MKIYFKKSQVVVKGPLNDNRIHAHHAIQIVFSDLPFTVSSENENKECNYCIIGRDVPHMLSGGGKIILLIEPETKLGEAIKVISPIPINRININDNQKVAIEKLIYSQSATVDDYVDFAITLLGIKTEENLSLDPRIADAIDYIETAEINTVDDIAKKVSLSLSRLQHLFKEQIGISIKRYLLWKKMQRGISLMTKSNDLTKIALESGFSDSSHFSKTFNNMFGFSPSVIFKNPTAVEVILVD